MSRTPKTYACSHAWIYSLALPLTLSLSMLLIVTAWPIISLVSHQAFFLFFFQTGNYTKMTPCVQITWSTQVEMNAEVTDTHTIFCCTPVSESVSKTQRV